jgi:cold shock CspA family protein
MGENTDTPKDIFAHYSNINVKNSQYKYLVQGEYVEFVLVNAGSGNHEFHATDVSGIAEGPLMCETHRLNNITSSSFSRPPRKLRLEKSVHSEHHEQSTEPNHTSDFQVVKLKRSNTRQHTK